MDARLQKILVIFGTRPEAIKLAPLIREMESRPDSFRVRTCVTAQHRDMLDQVLNTFAIAPHYDLEIMQDGQHLFQAAARCLERLYPILSQERPDWVLVQGDTTTAFIASLAAFYSGLRVGHVEAGLRTGQRIAPFPEYTYRPPRLASLRTGRMTAPFPEEMNRRLITSLADLHFAPTERARENLLRENIAPGTIHVTGNTGIDALLYATERCSRDALVTTGLERWSGDRPVLLVTGHRRESFGEPLRQVCQALRRIAERGDVDVIYPAHLNPNVRQPVRDMLADLPNVFVLEPLDYIPFIGLMRRAHIILTDSGGIQEEAPYLGKPVLVMRDVTERPETVQAGSARLVGTSEEKIVLEIARLLEDPAEYARMSCVRHLFGDGQASSRIARILAEQAE